MPQTTLCDYTPECRCIGCYYDPEEEDIWCRRCNADPCDCEPDYDGRGR